MQFTKGKLNKKRRVGCTQGDGDGGGGGVGGEVRVECHLGGHAN